MAKKSTTRSLPSLSSLRSTGGASRLCRCGCGSLTKSTWRSGCDGRVKGAMVMLVKGEVTWARVAEVMSPAFARCCFDMLRSQEMVERWGIEASDERIAQVISEFEIEGTKAS